jgi:hypothetical protein
MKSLLTAAIFGAGILGVTLTQAQGTWPGAGWKGPYDIRAVSSQISLINGSYVSYFYINGPVELNSWCGSDNPLKFYWGGNEAGASLASAKAAQANVLTAFTGGFKIKAKFKGADGCAIDDVIVCGAAGCNPN